MRPKFGKVELNAEPGTRTRKSLRTLEPESSASTKSASTAYSFYNQLTIMNHKRLFSQSFLKKLSPAIGDRGLNLRNLVKKARHFTAF